MLSRKDAVAQLWKRGELKWKLHNVQKEMHEEILKVNRRIITIVCSRRLGKSYYLLLMAIELCLTQPNSIVKYVCPKQKMVKTILKPIMREIVKDCPAELRPEFKTQDNIYVFPNGSEIQMAGSDNGNAENVRGGASHLCIVDEAGFVNDLDYVVKSILFPTTATTKGKIILASTPSKEPEHEFITRYMIPYDMAGDLIFRTIYDNPMLDEQDIEEIIAEYTGGVNNPEFRREYLCEIIRDEEDSIIPEFTPELQERIVVPWEKPAFYDAYVAMDIGFKDLTVVLFAYYDFKNAKLVIDNELVLNGPKMTTDSLAEEIRLKEVQTFSDPITHEVFKPYLRVSDNNLIVINDLEVLHGLTFLPTSKDNKEAAINNARIEIGKGNVIINPRCETLVKHLKYGVWNKPRTSYARSADNGHYDAVDAFVYLMRNIHAYRNPYPSNYNHGPSAGRFDYHQAESESAVAKTFKKMFKINK